MNAPSAFFFDFDGVIVESVDIKTEAFRELFSFDPKNVDAMVDYHVANTGVSRYEKFRHYYETLLNKPLPNGESERLDREFSRLVFEKVVACPFVPGALEFLENYSSRRPCFVVSATPESELQRIVEARRLTRHFVGVYGSPLAKLENVREIVSSRRITPANALFVGDGAADYEAASAAGMPFVARVVDSTREFWTLKRVPMVEDLIGLEGLIRWNGGR
ncbi:MAG: HAD hydrolase-like protein [Elusimicrobia bacterium]|nr:HAD hydrolase-like protein [Elusimicrobiota bacterium]